MLWRRLDLTKRQELQRKIFVDGIVCEGLDKIRTAEMSPSFELIEAITAQKDKNVTPAGFEPAIFGMKARRPGPLDEGASDSTYYIKQSLPRHDYITICHHV